MEPAGWAVMLVSVSFVLSIMSYCTYRVLTLPPVDMDELHGPLDIDTGDTTDAD